MPHHHNPADCADCSSSGGVHHSSRCAAPCCIHYWKYFIKLLMLLWLVFIDNQNYGLVFVQRIFMYDRSVVNFFWSDVFKSNLFSWLSLKSEILENVLLSDFFRPNLSDVWPPHSSCSWSFFIILFICKQNTCRYPLLATSNKFFPLKASLFNLHVLYQQLIYKWISLNGSIYHVNCLTNIQPIINI